VEKIFRWALSGVLAVCLLAIVVMVCILVFLALKGAGWWGFPLALVAIPIWWQGTKYMYSIW
jgi:hypothetical protein